MRLNSAAFAAVLFAAACPHALEAAAGSLFDGGRVSNYNGNTRIAAGAEAAGADFVVSCTRTGACETAWGVFSRRIKLPGSAAAYAYSFEIRADEGWKKPETSGKSWDNAICWFDSAGEMIARRRLNLEFRGGDFARFLFSGAVPAGAKQAEVQFGVDAPNLRPGETVSVRNVSFTTLPKGAAVPGEVVPDLLAPVVASRFASPFTDPRTVVRYEIIDTSAVDWASVAVTDAVSKAAVPFTRTGNVITLRPGVEWTSGRHLVDVYARDAAGNAAVARKAFLSGQAPAARRVCLRDDGAVLLDGKPFFPIGMYAVSRYDFNGNDFDNALAGLKRAGFNMVHSYGDRFDPDLFAAAAKHGMVQWTSGHGAYNPDDSWFMDTGRGDGTVLAWYIGDDTSMNTPPGRLFDRDEAVRMLDGTRITCHADGVRASAAKSNYQEYVNYADVFLPEIYPIDGFKDERCVAEVCRDMDRCLADIRDYGDGSRPRGVWPILQCFHGKGWKRYPTPREMYAMSFAAVIHGGNGITWFKYGADIGERGTRYSGMFRTPEDWAAMTNISARIASLAPVLLERTPPGQEVPEVVSGPAQDPLGQPSVTVLLKNHAGSSYILAVNASTAAVRARFRTHARAKTCKVAWEKRRIPVAGGTFEDSFEPFDVHVYRID